MKLQLGDKTCHCATTLRVAYAMKDLKHADSLQEALKRIGQLDTDGQIELLYVAYKCSKENGTLMSFEEFRDAVLDNLGVYALGVAIQELSEGLMYAGLPAEEVEAKKKLTEEIMAQQLATAGATSSVEDTESV